MIGGRVDPALLSSALNGSRWSLDECMASGILVADGTGLRFRHELVRMAVEAAIAPHRKTELHARLLAVLEERGDADPALLAHHAEGAGDEKAVQRHAPEAARRSSALGAHREAAAQFERALRFAHESDRPALAALHEGLSGEYALLDRWDEAERPLRAALSLRRELGDDLSVGTDLRMLSKTMWRLCRGDEAGQAADEAVRGLETLPPSTELAWAYANLGAFHMDVGQHEDAIEFGEKARDLGERLHHAPIVSDALNTIGCTYVNSGRDGMDSIEEALRIALDADLQDAAGRAFCNLQSSGASLNKFAESERYYLQGMAYSEERELGVYSMCLMGGRACTLLLTGEWDEAADLCARLLDGRRISPVNRLNPLLVTGRILGRRGETGAAELLDEALALAEGTGEPQWIVPVRAARAELRWLSGEHALAVQEAQSGYDCAVGHVDPWMLGSMAIWLPRLQAATGLPAGLPELPEPFAREMAGDFRGAAAAWEGLGRPYDAAMAWLGSTDEAGLREALNTLDDLGALAAAAAARRRMKELGIRAIPRGPRRATRAAPAGLTAREQEVLALLADGLADREISRRLFISERTVHHHVSAVLAKIGVASRTAAAREAARMGIGATARA